MPATQCDFCNEFSGSVENTFDKIYHSDPKSRVLYRSEQFVVIPSLGQIVGGYLLVVPTKHWTALADLPDADLEDLSELCCQIRAVIEREYGSCIFYEHGTRSVDAGGCGIYHAHLHAVPLSRVLDLAGSLRLKFPCTQLNDLSELTAETKGLPAYLFYQDNQSRSYVFDTGILPSQFMRKLVAQALKGNNWDWRNVGREALLLNTLARLSRYADYLRETCKNTRSRK